MMWRIREERGQGLVEYALILALVSLAAILALTFLSGKINELFSKAGNSLNTVQVAGGATGGATATATGGTATATATATATGGNTPPSYVSGGNLGGCTPNCDDGETITVSSSTWNGSPAPTLSYQWKVSGDSGDAGSCNFNDNDWSNTGSNSTSFVLPNPSGGGTDSVGVRITATNVAGTATRDVCTTFDH
jgi:pilus assembly protein Flp/PilA